MIFFTAILILGQVLLSAAPKTIQPQVIRAFPHQSGGFTQGFAISGDTLLEGTGLFNKSAIYMLDLNSGEILRNISVRPYFGEGIALMENRLVQLSWKAGLALVYEYPSLVKLGEFKYEGEGWGLSSQDNLFYMSNGSDSIYVRDNLFNIKRVFHVSIEGKGQKNLNELEFARGKLYANVWYAPYILKINPQDGSVESIYDCTNIIALEKPGNPNNVLNGIAFNPSSQTFYLTGKNWNQIFEVVFPDG